MKKKQRNFLVRALLTGVLPLLALTSCFQEEQFTATPGTGDADITFSLALPGTNPAGTRALSETDENQVDNIDVLVFQQGASGKYVYSARCSGTAIATDGSNPGKKTFTVTLRQGDYDLVILANARSLCTSTDLSGKTKQQALDAITMSNTGKWIAKNSTGGYKPIPMWGNVGNLSISENTSLTGSNAVKLTRMIARVDVLVAGAVTNFQLKSVRVYNRNTAGSIAPKSLTAADWDTTTDVNAPKAVQPNVPSASVLTKGPLVYSDTDGEVASKQCTSEIYLFEAENHTNGSNHATRKNLTDRTCLVIGGVFDNDTQPTYYRVDFSSGSGVSQAYKDVLRNHQYIFSITKVSAAGFSDPDDAFNSAPVNIEANVLEWNDGSMSEVVFDGQNMLSVSKGIFDIPKDADSYTVDIKTDVTTGWKATAMDSWITFPSDFTGPKDLKKTLTFNVTENTTGDVREGKIKITAGRLEYIITVSQSLKAKKVASFTFIEMKNVDGTGTSVPLAGGTITAKVNTNMGWALKTDKAGLEDLMPEPSNETADDYTLSIAIPAADGWSNASTTVWVEYNGIRFSQTTYTQTGYNITVTGAPTTVNKYGEDVTLNLSGYFPAMNFRAVNATDVSKVVSTVVACTATGTATANGTSTVALKVNPNGTGSARNIKFQYEKSSGVWVDIATASQEWNGLQLPTAGVIAPPGVIGVGAESGKLTLDGSKEYGQPTPGTAGETVYVVYFKWGSTVAMSAGTGESDTFDKTDIAWLPSGFAGNITNAYTTVPYENNTSFPAINNAAGKGDPCRLAVRNGTTGGYRIPTGSPSYEKFTDGGWTNYSGVNGRWSNFDGAQSQFYPAAGLRTISAGTLSGSATFGYYWSGTPSSYREYYLWFDAINAGDGVALDRQSGVAVRCVRE